MATSMLYKTVSRMPNPQARIAHLRRTYGRGCYRAMFEDLGPGQFEHMTRGTDVSTMIADFDDDDRAAWAEYAVRVRKRDKKLERLCTSMAGIAADADDMLLFLKAIGDLVDDAVQIWLKRETVDGGAYADVFHKSVLGEHVAMQAKKGYGSFYAVHEFPRGAARRGTEVRRPRLLVADWDVAAGHVMSLDLLVRFPPDFIVRSAGGYHAIWILPEEDRANFSVTYVCRVIAAFAKKHGSDDQVALATQIMRLPGSIHVKRAEHPFVTEIIYRRGGAPRTGTVDAFVKAFELDVPTDAEVMRVVVPKREPIDVDPSEHPALAKVLDEMQEQGLQPERSGSDWIFFCPLHEAVRLVEADLDDGTPPEFGFERHVKNKSGIVRVNADRSLWVFCGSRCGGSSGRRIVEALGLSPGILYADVPGGYYGTDYAKARAAHSAASESITDEDLRGL